MQLCRLKFFQPGSPLLAHRLMYTRLSPERLSQPSSHTPTTTHSPSNFGVEVALTRNTPRTMTSSTVSPPEAPVSSQNSSMSPVPEKREIINPTSRYTQFGIVAGMFLRHTARSLGFLVLPNGFIRVSEMLNYDFFGKFNFSEFADLVKNDPMDRFEMSKQPDLVNGVLQDVWWVRAKYGHSMLGVNHVTKRILNLRKLRVVYHIARVSDWHLIRQHGISEGPAHLVQLFDNSRRNIFNNNVPAHSKALCISIDPEKAGAMGVKFFHTPEAQLIACGDWDRKIPFKAFNSVIELDITKETLK